MTWGAALQKIAEVFLRILEKYDRRRYRETIRKGHERLEEFNDNFEDDPIGTAREHAGIDGVSDDTDDEA